MISAIPHIDHQRINTFPSLTLRGDGAGLKSSMETFPPAWSIQDRTSELFKALRDPPPFSVPSGICFKSAAARRSYFSNAAHRQAFVFGPSDVFTIDFCYGFLEFKPKIVLRIPGGISFDLMHYWDGQPVRFVCCERKRPTNDQSADGQEPWGRVFWAISIEPYGDKAVTNQ